MVYPSNDLIIDKKYFRVNKLSRKNKGKQKENVKLIEFHVSLYF